MEEEEEDVLGTQRGNGAGSHSELSDPSELSDEETIGAFCIALIAMTISIDDFH
jgi:hypothetical protein